MRSKTVHTPDRTREALDEASSIQLTCKPHGAPAVFFSKAHNANKCFMCLIDEQDLIYIDKEFK